MKPLLAIFALLTLAVTAHADAFRSGNYDSGRGFSFDSFDKKIQQFANGHDNRTFSWENLNKSLKHEGKGRDKDKFASNRGNDLWKTLATNDTETNGTPCTNVPDGGASIVMLGFGILALAGMKRAFRN